MKYLFFALFFIITSQTGISQVCITLDDWTFVSDNLDGTCTYDLSVTVDSGNGASGTITFSIDGTEVYSESNCVCNPTTITFPVTIPCNSSISIDGNYDAPGMGNDCSGTTDNTALPVEWLNFTILNNINFNILEWNVLEKSHEIKYILEKSYDGKNFDQLTVLESSRYTSEIKQYSFHDFNPFMGINYYRIKQIDLDGSFSYSDLVLTNNQIINESQIFPNPFQNILNIKLSNGSFWTISNAMGKRVLYGSEQLIDTSHLPVGLYFLTINIQEKSFTSTLSKYN